MLESFIVVGTQVFILFILISLGFMGTKAGFIKEEGISTITEIMLYIVTPAVIINAFQKDFNYELFVGFMIAFGSAVLSHIISIVLSKLFIHNQDEFKRVAYRFGTIFSNCGFMSFPLLEAILGEEGLFYGASYIAVFNLLVWSYGLILMDKDTPKLSAKKIFLNPGTLPVIIGMIFFFTSFHLPKLIMTPIQYLSALNTPVPMLVIGFYVAQIKWSECFSDKEEIIMMFLRLIASPAILMGVLLLMGIRGNLLVACVLSAAAPVATTSTMFAIRFNRDPKLTSRAVAVSTLFSIVTLTLMVGLAKYFAF